RAHAPPHFIELSNDRVCLIFEKTIDRYLHVAVLFYRVWVISFSGIQQIAGLDLNGEFAEVQIAVARRKVERISAVDVSASRRYQCQIQHRQGSFYRCERRMDVLHERIPL